MLRILKQAMMKRLLLTCLLMAVAALCHAQTSTFDSVFDEFSGEKGYQSVIYGKKMLSMLKEDASNDVRKLLDGIRMIRIISHKGDNRSNLCDSALDKARSKDYELISRMDKEDSSSWFFLQEPDRRDQMMSFVMITSSTENSVVLEIIGRFDVKDISRLSVIGQKK